MLSDDDIQAQRDRVSALRAVNFQEQAVYEALDGWSAALDALVQALDWGCSRPDWPGEWGHDPHRFHPDGPHDDPFHVDPDPNRPGPWSPHVDPHPDPGPFHPPDPGPHVGPGPQPHPNPQPGPAPHPQPGPHDPHGRP